MTTLFTIMTAIAIAIFGAISVVYAKHYIELYKKSKAGAKINWFKGTVNN